MKYPGRASKHLKSERWPATDNSTLPRRTGELGD